MSAYGTLLRLSLLNHWAGFRRGSWRKANGKTDVSRIVTMALVLALFAGMAWFVISVEIMLSHTLGSIGQPMLLPALALFVAMVSTLILGLFPTMSALYFNRDAAWMAFLPVPSTAVMAVKWTELYFGDVLINLGIVGPAAVLYGLNVHAGALFYLRSIAVILASPLLPMVLITLLVTLLARLTGLTRHREALMMVGSLLAVALVWGIEFTLLPRIEEHGALYIVQMLTRKNGLVDILLRSVPPVEWAVLGMQGDWVCWALFLMISGAAAAACLMLVGKGYLSICLNQTEHATKRRSAKVSERDWRARGQLKALFLREWNELVKTPVYAMNTFSGAIIFPVMLLAMYLGMSSSGEAMGSLVSELQGLLKGFSPLDLTLILAGCLAFPSFVNVAASTAISREGGRLALSRMLPVPARTQLRAKLLTGLVVNLMSMAIALIVLAAILPGFTPYLLPAALLATAISYATAAFSLTFDAIHPRFNWINETQAMKQNFNAIVSMLLSIVMLGLDVAIPFLLLGASPAARMTCVIAALLAECLIGFLLMRFIAEKKYAALEG